MDNTDTLPQRTGGFIELKGRFISADAVKLIKAFPGEGSVLVICELDRTERIWLNAGTDETGYARTLAYRLTGMAPIDLTADEVSNGGESESVRLDSSSDF